MDGGAAGEKEKMECGMKDTACWETPGGNYGDEGKTRDWFHLEKEEVKRI